MTTNINNWITVDEAAATLGTSEEQIAHLITEYNVASKQETVLSIPVTLVNCEELRQALAPCAPPVEEEEEEESLPEPIEEVKLSKKLCPDHPKAYWDGLRKHLAQKYSEAGSWEVFGKILGGKVDAVRKFVAGRADQLTFYTMDVLGKAGLFVGMPTEVELSQANPTSEPEPITEAKPEKKTVPPLETWSGATKSTAEAARDKGRSASTIRRWAKEGKLNYIRQGRKIFVCVDEKYEAIVANEKGRMYAEIERLRKENAELKERLAPRQAEFDFDSFPRPQIDFFDFGYAS